MPWLPLAAFAAKGSCLRSRLRGLIIRTNPTNAEINFELAITYLVTLGAAPRCRGNKVGISNHLSRELGVQRHAAAEIILELVIK